MAYRRLSASAEAQSDYDAFLQELETAITEGLRDPNEIVRDTLYQLFFGPLCTITDQDQLEVPNDRLTTGGRALLHSLDPRNITTEPEYYTDIDTKLYFERKPYMWLWQMFDRSPLGQNALVGHQLRRMLAPLIFRRVGKNFKCWHFVEWSFGYNLSIGDDVVIHRHVLLDDRGGIEIGNQVSVSDYVNIYSHSHDIDDISKVYTPQTKIGDGVRITYHATILAGIEVGEHSMVGTGAIVTSNVEPYHVVVGVPAKSVKIKAPRNSEVSALAGE